MYHKATYVFRCTGRWKTQIVLMSSSDAVLHVCLDPTRRLLPECQHASYDLILIMRFRELDQLPAGEDYILLPTLNLGPGGIQAVQAKKASSSLMTSRILLHRNGAPAKTWRKVSGYPLTLGKHWEWRAYKHHPNRCIVVLLRTGLLGDGFEAQIRKLDNSAMSFSWICLRSNPGLGPRYPSLCVPTSGIAQSVSISKNKLEIIQHRIISGILLIFVSHVPWFWLN